MIDETVLFLTFTDQYKWGFSDKMGIYLNCVYDLDDNWYEPMCQVFTNVIRYDTYRGANIGGVCQANREIIKIAEIYRPKFVIYPCDFSGIVTETTLFTLRKIGCIVVGYFFDDDDFFETRSRWMIPYIDYFVTAVDNQRGLISAYERVGARCFPGLPPPLNPAIHCKQLNAEKVYDATFVGMLKANRSDFLANIAGCGSEVMYLGGGQEQKMHWSEMVKIYNQSRINLNFSGFYRNMHPDARRIVCRVFEITLCGGFLLTEYANGLENYFDIGREIECFETAKEAAEKIQYYLKHPEEREQIAKRGYLRAHRDYTGQAQFNRIFHAIEDDLYKRGRPEIIPPLDGIMNTEMYKMYSREYFKWTCALRKCSSPLKAEWLATAELILQVNPNHKGASRLLKRAKKWGYPEPFFIRLGVLVGHIVITCFGGLKMKADKIFQISKLKKIKS